MAPQFYIERICVKNEGKRYIILEHETFGNDVDWVVIEAENDTGIYEAVEDEDIIELAYSIV
ncbi:MULTISPECIES: hypothetical protein [unclassified Mammaliicoccus]|uniref:hypothetical protein n=1 Tax=unclassified Mammaliicoccus TaxID=2803851 RepID=UPI001EFB6803|nr:MULTISPECIES: hypothetical protein [unclassified Mammaliicoccus]